MVTAKKVSTAKTAASKKVAAKKAPARKPSAKTVAAKKAPWDRDNPKAESGEPTHHLTPAQKASAKRAAKKAGRPYPNLVDNMHAAEAAKKKAS